MLAALKFVQGAVAKKDYTPSLTHFCIQGGRIRGFNGAVALCSPIPLDLDVAPKADTFTKAIAACKETTRLSLTQEKRLRIESGDFRVFVECLNEPFPNVVPEGTTIPLNGKLLEAVKKLAPFIAEDASRKWAAGILFRGMSAFATNNIVLVEYWLGYPFPVEVNIPKQAVAELLRIGEEPTAMQVSPTSITFHYEGNRWLRSQSSPIEWPDVAALLNTDCDPKPFPVGFFPAVERLSPFVDKLGQVFFVEGALTTSPSTATGATVAVEGVAQGPVFHAEHLKSIEGLALRIDFTKYPAPCLFFGDMVRGAIVGIRA